jgi:O-antigen ligase
LTTKDKRIKVVLFGVFILSISALILSTSRGGWAGFLGSAAVWTVYMSMSYGISAKRIAAVFFVIAVIAATVVYFSPNIKERFTSIKSDAASFHERTDIWTPLVAAALERPVFGWGYGPKIFTMDKPFENTPYKAAPVNIKPAFRNPHNPFLRVLFHQGVAGLIPYIALLIVAAGTFWNEAVFRGRNTSYLKKGESADMKNYILVACTSIIIGTYFVNAIVENSHITEVAFVLGLGLAAFKLKNENSDT